MTGVWFGFQLDFKFCPEERRIKDIKKKGKVV